MKKLIVVVMFAVMFSGCIAMQPNRGTIERKRISGPYYILHLKDCNEPLQDSGQIIVSRRVYEGVIVGDYIEFEDIDRCKVVRHNR